MAGDENLKFDITADTAQFINQVQSVIGKLGQMGDAGLTATKSLLKAFNDPTMGAESLRAMVETVDAGLTKFGSTAAGAGDTAEKALKKPTIASEFLKGAIGSLSKEVVGFSKAFELIGVASKNPFTLVGATIVATAVGIGTFSKAMAGAQKEVTDLSKSTNLSQDSLRRLQIVANRSGADLKDLASGVTKAHDTIRDIEKPTDDAAVMIKTLGLNLKSLESAGPEQQFRTLADAILKVKDEATAGAMAQELLGMSLEKLKAAYGGSASDALALKSAEDELIASQTASASAWDQVNAATKAFKEACGIAAAGAVALGNTIMSVLGPVFAWVIETAASVAKA
ncbi:MAG: hypothetical protein EOO77_33000, partial [Oxalobacteraceae bacterium]